MKRQFYFFITMLTIAGLGYGFSWSMHWEHWDTLRQRRWLENLFRRRGYTVVWEQNASVAIERFRLTKPEVQTEELYRNNFEKLRESNIIAFYEHKNNIIFVFGKRVYSLKRQQGVAPNLVKTPYVPASGQIWFNLLGGGEFAISCYKEIERLFPFNEVKTLGARPRHILYVFGVAESAVYLYWMFILYTAWRQRQPARLPKAPMVITQPTKNSIQQIEIPSYNLPAKPPPFIKEDIDILRLRVINALDDLIATHNEDLMSSLQAMRREAQSEKRAARLRYLLTHRISSLLEQNVDAEILEKENSSAPPAPIETGKQNIRPILPFDHLVPPEISLPCVKAIVWILLNRSGKAPYFGVHRCRYENLQRLVMHEGFGVEEWKIAFDWLREKGVLLYENPHRTGFSCSINPKKQEASFPGDEIIGILVATRRKIQKQN